MESASKRATSTEVKSLAKDVLRLLGVRKTTDSQEACHPPLEADNWIKQGGTDPEVQITPKAEPQESKGKPYPHRVSFDMTKEQYKRLKRAFFEEERSLNDVLRKAVEDWMKTRNY